MNPVTLSRDKTQDLLWTQFSAIIYITFKFKTFFFKVSQTTPMAFAETTNLTKTKKNDNTGNEIRIFK